MNSTTLDFLLVLGIVIVTIYSLVRRSRRKKQSAAHRGCDGCSGCIYDCECPQEQPAR